MNEKSINIAIIGLGYVGLPLAIEFSKKYNLIGFDKDQKRIIDLTNCVKTKPEKCQKKNYLRQALSLQATIMKFKIVMYILLLSQHRLINTNSPI